MARREITQYFDDMNNTPLTEDELNIIRFSLDGTDYIVDLSNENAARFREQMAPYIKVARRAPQTRRGRSSSTNDHAFTRKVRDWAASNGYQVAKRGKIPAKIIEAYNDAHIS